jgi:hypothetical protein
MHTAICDELGIEFPIFWHCGTLQDRWLAARSASRELRYP